MKHKAIKYIPLLGMIASCSNPTEAEQSPNIIFILCDDLGYGDLGCYGQKYIHTPRLDTMAARGIRFTQAYAGSPVSAPSRATLMTGQHTGHTEVRGNKEYWKNAPMVRYGRSEEFAVVGQHPYDTARIILPELMKRQGYTTGLFGKWAGGHEGSVSTPDKRGVDEFFGYICQYQAHLYYPDFLNRFSREKGDTSVTRVVMEGNIRFSHDLAEYMQRPQYSADMIHQKALEWIDSQSDEKPFFGMLTYTLPHAELVGPTDSLYRSYEKTFRNSPDWKAYIGSRYHSTDNVHAQYAAMVTRLDAYVGEIIDLLERKGLDKNTLIFFSSDNGPHQEGGGDPEFFNSNGGLKGIKRQTHEGGIRVPFIAYWPGTISGGQVSEFPIIFYDIMPTLIELTGAEKVKTDGISILPAIIGNEDENQEREFLYWEFEETDQVALRQGYWKLICKSGVPHLYNLLQDPSEQTDLADQYPELVAQMIETIRGQHTESPHFKVTIP
jgi:arylsulfatase A-like enzyme